MENRRHTDRRIKDRGWRFAFALVGIAAAFAYLAFGQQSCGKSVSGPTPIVDTGVSTPAATPVPVAATPTTVEDPTQAPDPADGKKVRIDENGNVTLNINPDWTWTACVYQYADYHKQSLSHSFRVRNGANAFDAGPLCGDTLLQVDVQTGPECPKDPWVGPFQGFRNGRSGIKYSGEPCCSNEWVSQEPIVEYGEWSACAAPVVIDSGGVYPLTHSSPPPPPVGQCPGVKTRIVTTTMWESNTCGSEPRIKEGYPQERESKEECTFECQPSICHTENDKWCGDKYVCHGFNCDWEYVCQNNDWNNITRPDPIKKWQCQNIPPDTPGHFSTHFQSPYGDSNSHDDFFGDVQNPTALACGAPGTVTDRCYSIVN